MEIVSTVFLTSSFSFRYLEIPVVSRLYLTGAFLTTTACAVDLITPFSLYFNWDLIFVKGQVWRLITNYLFFGAFSMDFLFHMYFLVRTFASLALDENLTSH
jgi:Derlin-2/3